MSDTIDRDDERPGEADLGSEQDEQRDMLREDRDEADESAVEDDAAESDDDTDTQPDVQQQQQIPDPSQHPGDAGAV